MSGRSEIALDEQGRREALCLAGRLKDVPLAAIHASPCRRAVETAETVAIGCGLEVRSIPALDEIDFGEWSGRSFASLDAEPAWRHWNAARATAATPGGETMAIATARAFDHLAASEIDGPLLCISHCDIIRGVVARVLGLGFERLFAFDCDPASLTTLAADGASMRLVALNERPR